MQQATCAHSGAATGTSSGNIETTTALALSRRSLIGSAGVVLIGAAISLQPSCWFEHFDPETWVERWYRAGHKIAADPHGRVVLVQNMDADENHAQNMRAELGWHGRDDLRSYLRLNYQPARPDCYCGWVRKAA